MTEMAETTQRSTRKRSSDGTSVKKFICEAEGCGRSFTRSEHLQRHTQNHTEGEHTCDRCRAHFKRRDLLERHIARHRQKDDEGSVLNTRKRCWKDSEGNIVAKRPSIKEPQADSHQIQATSDFVSFLQGHEQGAPISPPISQTPSYGQTFSDTHTDNQWRPSQAVSESNPQVQHNHTDERFWSSSAAPAVIQGPREDLLYDDIFNPDTASSFNMPFTTMNNYNWLFDLDLSGAPDHVDPGNLLAQNLTDFQQQHSIPEHNFGAMDLCLSNRDIIDPNNHGATPLVQANAPCAPEALNPIVSPPFTDHGSQNGRASSFDAQSIQHIHASGISNTLSVGTPERPADGPYCLVRTISTQSESHPDMERPMSNLQPSKCLPIIDEIARAQILDLIDTAQPVTPDGGFVTRDHPLLSLSSLQTYCDLYFTRFNTAYPLIHQATFDASHVETLLLVSILLLGATYGEKDAHQLAVCIHDVLRPQIFANAGFSARPELWVLQTILLVECFGKSRAGQKQHDMSHLFHGLLINLIRRSDCQSIRPPNLHEGTEDLEDDWRTWVDAEQKKRLAFLCFMWDTQHAVLFCQSLCMSAFELRSTLPCEQSLWEADSAVAWHQLRQKQATPPLFLTCLKSYLCPGGAPQPKHLNALSRLLLLHGLMSISWDMKRRDQTSLGLMGKNPMGNWKTRMSASYDAWHADFTAYCKTYTTTFFPPSPTRPTPTYQKEFASFATATLAIYHSAHIILHAEFLDLQIYAGARHILGRPVARPDYVRSQRVVKRWVADEREAASKAAWHAARLLKDGLQELDGFEAGGLFHYPWCLYLATLTVWAFHHARPSGANGANGAAGKDGAGSGGHMEDEDEIIWDVKAEMMALLNWMTGSPPKHLESASGMGWVGKKGTSGLTAVVCKSLSKVRWAVVHDGMMVLRGLVPWRSVSMYEGAV